MLFIWFEVTYHTVLYYRPGASRTNFYFTSLKCSFEPTYGGCCKIWHSQNFNQFGIHKEKLKSKILIVDYPTLINAKAHYTLCKWIFRFSCFCIIFSMLTLVEKSQKTINPKTKKNVFFATKVSKQKLMWKPENLV